MGLPNNFNGIKITDPRMALCPLHVQPFRPKWPQGYINFVAEGLKKVMAMEEVIMECKAGSDVADIGQLERLLYRKPICCWLSAEQMIERYIGATIGFTGICEQCKLMQPGAPFQYANQRGKVISLDHLCFECLVTCFSKKRD